MLFRYVYSEAGKFLEKKETKLKSPLYIGFFLFHVHLIFSLIAIGGLSADLILRRCTDAINRLIKGLYHEPLNQVFNLQDGSTGWVSSD